MRYVSAYLLCQLTGKEPSCGEIEKILGAVGIDINPQKSATVVQKLNANNVELLIENGLRKIAMIPVGGGAAVAAVAGAPAAAAAPAAEKKEEKKVEKEDSESDDDMGFGLFD